MHSPRLKTLAGLSTQPASLTVIDLEASEKQSSITEYECTICLSTYSTSEILITCSQNHKFCKTCLQLFFKSQITEFKGEAITCPQDSCAQLCNENVICVLLNDQEMKLYEQKKIEKMVSKNPHMKFCPQAGCSRVYKPSKSKDFTICKCQSKICNACGELWHEGKTCQQATDPGFEEYIKENEVKFCVMCKTVVQKIEGCLHITCPVCDYEWCWSCGREYTPLHLAKCPREWMPEPPKRVLNEQKMTWESKRTQAIMDNLLYVLSIPVKLFFLPFVLFNLWGIMMDADKVAKKIFIFSLGIIFSLIYDAILFAIITGVIGAGDQSGDPVLILVLLIVLTPYLCYIIPDIVKTCRKGKFHKKRWMSRNVDMFGFKPSKVTPNNQNVQDQNGAQIQPLEIPNQAPEVIVIQPKESIVKEESKNQSELSEIKIA